MGILHEVDAGSVISELQCRGLSREQIDWALQKMVGKDWQEITVIAWHRRLQEKNLIVHDDEARFLDDLEALVNGRTMLDDLHRRYHRWGRA